MRIASLREEDRGRWDRYVLDSATASCYHLSGWKGVVETTFRHPCHYLLAEESGGRIEGVLPLVQIRSRIFGHYLVSLPYFNYGGVCAGTREAEELLLGEAIRIAREAGARHVELRHTRSAENGLAVKTSKVSMRRALPADPRELWNGLGSKLRSQVRRPEKAGMTARVGGTEELDAFYRVFSENMRDLGTPVYPRDFFRNILHAFPQEARICTVRSGDGQPVASGFLLGFKETLEIPWASSLRNKNRFSPNMLLYWTALEHACRSGFRIFDFGRSTPGEGTFLFKQQWGARPVQLYWHYWLGEGVALPELNPHNPRYRLAIALWKRLPLSLTRLLGPRLVRNLP